MRFISLCWILLLLILPSLVLPSVSHARAQPTTGSLAQNSNKKDSNKKGDGKKNDDKKGDDKKGDDKKNDDKKNDDKKDDDKKDDDKKDDDKKPDDKKDDDKKPDQNTPEVNVPKGKDPKVNVPGVNVPKGKTPKVNMPKIGGQNPKGSKTKRPSRTIQKDSSRPQQKDSSRSQQKTATKPSNRPQRRFNPPSRPSDRPPSRTSQRDDSSPEVASSSPRRTSDSSRSRSPFSKAALRLPLDLKTAPANVTALIGQPNPYLAQQAQENPFQKIIEVIPEWFKWLLLILSLVAVLLAASNLLTWRSKTILARQRKLALNDIGLLQAALLPPLPELTDIKASVAYRPSQTQAAGGDFYDLFLLDDNKIGILLGDVSGHDQESLALTALVRYSLRAYLQSGMEPREALATAGEALRLPDEKFASVALASYDQASLKLTLASAGHPYPIIIGKGSFDTPTTSSPPLGGLETGFRQTSWNVQPGDRMLFFSDGLIEAKTQEGLLGREKLEEIFTTHNTGSASELLDKIEKQSQSIDDDMAALSLEFSGVKNSDPELLRQEELVIDTWDLDYRLKAFLDELSLETSLTKKITAEVKKELQHQKKVLLKVNCQEQLSFEVV
jgi:hypothetical protein